MKVWKQKKKKLTMKINKSLSFFLVCAGITFIMTACNGRPSGVMSRGEMVDFLTDLHKLDGALNAKDMGNAQDRKNLYYYNALLKKHGITQQQFDSSLVYYTRNPKKFERIYIAVIDNLTALQKDVTAHKYHPVDSAALRYSVLDLWQKDRKMVYTKDSVRKQLAFTIKNAPLNWQDTYVLSFLQKTSLKDSSDGKYVVIRVHYSDKVVDSIYTRRFADTLTRRFTIRIKADRKKSVDSISGKIVGYKRFKGTMNTRVDSIKLLRLYDAVAQDSLRTALMPPPPGPDMRNLHGDMPSVEKVGLRNKVLRYRNEKKTEQPAYMPYGR
jgi:hypothetical protein